MAGYGRDGKALLPLRYVANMFKEQTLKQLVANMQTQRIWPYEVYPGYKEENEYRRQQAERAWLNGKQGPWFSTGEGIKSFEGEVIEANEDSGMVTMVFKYNEYMQYVDIGVMQGVHAEDVNRSKKIQFKNRYISRWAPRAGSSHRSIMQPEFNHLLTRIEGYVQRYYDAKLDFEIKETLEDQPWTINLV